MLVAKVKAARITPKGFYGEEALLDDMVLMVRTCPRQRTLMLTGNYVVREGPNTEPGDPRLLGEEMLLTIELCARAYKRCVEAKVEPPTILLMSNDIVPETFESSEEERAFKKGYEVPAEIREILAAAGITQEPVYFFNRDFDASGKETAREMAGIRKRIAEGTEKLVVAFESFVQNLAGNVLSRGKIRYAEGIEREPSGRKRAIIPATIVDTFSEQPQLSPIAVTITNPNGAPYCSFLAATLFRQFENLGFETMTNAFVSQEYPCADKAAASYKHHFGGKMTIRNIYLNGASVVVDSTIK